jgi:hypothetical protein
MDRPGEDDSINMHEQALRRLGKKTMLLTMYAMCHDAILLYPTNMITTQKGSKTKDKRQRQRERKEKISSPLPTTTPTLPLSLPLNVNHHIHPSLPRQKIDAVPHVLEVGVRRCDDVDHAADAGFRVSWPVVVPVVVMVVRVRLVSVVEPEARDSVAHHPAQFAELLERRFDGVLEVFWHDEQQLLPGGDDERHGGGEDEDGDDDGCERVPEVPGLPQSHCGGNDDG